MKRISKRAVLALALVAALLFGLGVFLTRWWRDGSTWILFPGSPHVYENGRPVVGTVTDRNGEVLLDFTDGTAYHEDAAVRTAVLHLVGDRSGNIPNLFAKSYLLELTDYDRINGVYGHEDNELILTVSASISKVALEALEGRKGTVAVYNYKSGEILCAVSSSAYDPENPPDLSQDTTGVYDGVYLNRFLQGAYVPGSIFKLVTAAAAMEFVPDIFARTFTCNGTMEFGVDKVICAGNHGTIDLKTALAKSCNCAFAQIALLVGAEDLQATAEKLGLTQSFTVDGNSTRAGQFDLSVPADVNVAWAGIGQYTDLINPYAYLRYMGIIAGGGRGVEPYFVQRAGSYTAQTEYTDTLLSVETATAMKTYMANNVQTIYGAWNFPDIGVCAKSGTAELGEGLLPHATFAGFCDSKEYPLAFLVVVENGGAGSAVCTPIVGKVLSACVEELTPKIN